jgi:hypothetical protein
MIVSMAPTRTDRFWDRVAQGYADERRLAMVRHDDYPEYALQRVGPIPAEGAHNDHTAAQPPQTTAG